MADHSTGRSTRATETPGTGPGARSGAPVLDPETAQPDLDEPDEPGDLDEPDGAEADAGPGSPRHRAVHRASHRRTRWAWLRQDRLALWFLGISLVVGVFLVFFQPPGQGLDEEAHFLRVWAITNGHLLSPTLHGRAGAVTPTCIPTYFNRFSTLALGSHDFSLGGYWQAPRSCATSSFFYFENSSQNAPVAYVPQIVAVGILRAVGAPLPVVFFGGRLAALLGFVALGFTAIRLAPVGKAVLFVVALLPTTLLLASTYSEDTMAIGLTLVAAALVLSCWHGRRANLGTYGWLVAVLGALVLAKSTMVVAAPLVFVVPLALFAERRRPRLLQLAALVGVLVLSGLWYLEARTISLDAYHPLGLHHPLDPRVQQAFVEHHLLSYLGILGRSLFFASSQYEPLSGFFSAIGFYRPTLADANVAPLGIVILGTATLTLAYLLGAGAKRVVVGWDRLVAWVPVALVVVAVLVIETSFWLYWTPPGTATILGIQGRYFIPWAVMPVITLGILRQPWERLGAQKYVIAGSILMLLWLVPKILVHDFGL